VTNRPVNFSDPTGHRPCGDGEDIDCDGKLNNSIKRTGGCGGPGQQNCYGNKPNNGKDDIVKNLNDLAIATQDLATTIDAGFGLIEVGLVAAGCVISAEVGCVEGAWGGLLLGQAIFNVFGGNAAETGLSGVSLIFTVAADVLEDGEFGEATTTSLVTFGVGSLMFDPIGDFLIDGYASGYNHEIFNGIETIFNGGSLFKLRVEGR